MEIDKKLNLVIPVARDDGEIYVHSTPISNAVFKRYYKPIAKAFASIYKDGLDVTVGPRIAAFALEEAARDLGVWEGDGGVENGLMNEIRQRSNVVLPTKEGWRAIPLDDALRDKRFSEDEASEVENLICFFIAASAVHTAEDRAVALHGMTTLWKGQLSSSNSSEFAASLPTSTATETSPPTDGTASFPLR